jgi:superfamily II DNA/RNA helicase
VCCTLTSRKLRAHNNTLLTNSLRLCACTLLTKLTILLLHEQEPVQRSGVHIIVATPGRLADLLNSGKLTLDVCRYICLDEGDRMLDLGFDEEVYTIYIYKDTILRCVYVV